MACRLHKVLYGLKQAPRGWYERFHNYLVNIGFDKNDDHKNLYLKTKGGKAILLAKILVDDIIFGGQDALCKTLENEMKK